MLEKNSKLLTHNKEAWNIQAKNQSSWSLPVSEEFIQQAKAGIWEVHLTPQPLDKKWLGCLSGKKVLCLASAGGQQGPTLAAAGAEVTVYDLSDAQLELDSMVAERDGLNLKTVQGDMTDLGCFAAESFDLIFHPISNHYIENVNLVWAEAYRVLKRGGALLSSFYNPVIFIADRNPEDILEGIIRPRFQLPYADVKDLTKEELTLKMDRKEALVFGHSLQDLIGGQLDAGFIISNYFEDYQPHPRFLVDKYIPTFLSTKAIKL